MVWGSPKQRNIAAGQKREDARGHAVDAIWDICEVAGPLGVTIAMDDFGSAYSAVARLRTLPVTLLKIDRAMVLAATGELPPGERIGPASSTPEAGAMLLAGVMRLAGQLGLRTIVEGVESAEVRDLVQATGADMAQGYFFGRPAPFDDLVETLRQAARSPSA